MRMRQWRKRWQWSIGARRFKEDAMSTPLCPPPPLVLATLAILGLCPIPTCPAQGNATSAPPAPKPPPLPEMPSPALVREAMKRATTFFRREVSFAGGYAWEWPTDVSNAFGEDHEGLTLIMMQPPGTPSVGQAHLSAWRATQDPLYLQAAREAAQALIWCQLSSGGWDSDFEFDPRKARRYHFRRDVLAGDTDPAGRRAKSSLDDGKTGTALEFLLELAHDPASREEAPLREALRFGLAGLLAAQAPNGGWPQRFAGPADPTASVGPARLPVEWPRVWPSTTYDENYTLNDNNLLGVMRLLLKAHALGQDPACLPAARKLGDFLLLARLPEPQPGWAQQYNRDMEPVWARKFEPPALSSIESYGALLALADLWAATGEEKYLAPVKPALAWLRRSRLPDGSWARFYELGTNLPLYCKQDTYELTHEDTNLPTHYGFKIEGDLSAKLNDLEARLAAGREAWQAQELGPVTPGQWAKRARDKRSKVREALASLDGKGRWIDPKSGRLSARLFVQNMAVLTLYVEAGAKGGKIFTKMVLDAEAKLAREEKARQDKEAKTGAPAKP